MAKWLMVMQEFRAFYAAGAEAAFVRTPAGAAGDGARFPLCGDVVRFKNSDWVVDSIDSSPVDPERHEYRLVAVKSLYQAGFTVVVDHSGNANCMGENGTR